MHTDHELSVAKSGKRVLETPWFAYAWFQWNRRESVTRAAPKHLFRAGNPFYSHKHRLKRSRTYEVRLWFPDLLWKQQTYKLDGCLQCNIWLSKSLTCLNPLGAAKSLSIHWGFHFISNFFLSACQNKFHQRIQWRRWIKFIHRTFLFTHFLPNFRRRRRRMREHQTC